LGYAAVQQMQQAADVQKAEHSQLLQDHNSLKHKLQELQLQLHDADVVAQREPMVSNS
jgi:hypothetical protein